MTWTAAPLSRIGRQQLARDAGERAGRDDDDGGERRAVLRNRVCRRRRSPGTGPSPDSLDVAFSKRLDDDRAVVVEGRNQPRRIGQGHRNRPVADAPDEARRRLANRGEVLPGARTIVQHEGNRVVGDAHRQHVARPSGFANDEVVRFDVDDGAAARVGDRGQHRSAGAEVARSPRTSVRSAVTTARAL